MFFVGERIFLNEERLNDGAPLARRASTLLIRRASALSEREVSICGELGIRTLGTGKGTTP